jgi:hypothetical protein
MWPAALKVECELTIAQWREFNTSAMHISTIKSRKFCRSWESRNCFASKDIETMQL